jgi:pilus assembly protein CpaB
MDRQKLLLIFGGAWLSAALLTWLLYSATIAPKTEKTVPVLAAVRDMPAGTRLKRADVKMVRLAEKDLPKGAIQQEAMVLDRVLLFPVAQNEALGMGKVTSATGAEGLAATIEPGKRAISVSISDSSGVAGLIQPRAHVDVLFTRSGSMSEAVTTTILEDVVVLSMGRATEVQPTGTTAAPAANTGNPSRAATLLLTPDQARRLEWAKNQGKIALALRNPLDKGVLDDSEPTTAETMNLGAYTGSRARGRGPNLRDDKLWAQLTAEAAKPKIEKKEPPKPKHVIDVYRGDKHVQEIFQ